MLATAQNSLHHQRGAACCGGRLHGIRWCEMGTLTSANFYGLLLLSINVAEKIALLKNVSLEEVAKITTQNAQKLFKFEIKF